MSRTKKDENKVETKTVDGKTFSDFTDKFWFKDGDNIKVGDSFPKIMSGESTTLEVKDIFLGNDSQTWIIVITQDENIHLLKSSKQLK